MDTSRPWRPRCARPTDLVAPVRLDPSGSTGPTRGQARAKRWRRCAPGVYVPADAPTHVEQRILEQAARLGPTGAVTAWASLRWHGAAFFDGLAPGGRDPIPVPLLVGSGGTRGHPAVTISRAQLAPADAETLAGVRVTTVDRAVYDEVVRVAELWQAVTAISMAAAASLTTVKDFREGLPHRPAWEGQPLARGAAALARDDVLSPREQWLHLAWELGAGLPRAEANRPVFARDGSLLGVPDLLDEEAGLVAEYDGAHHLGHARRLADVTREDRFRTHGLEYVEVVRGDSRKVAAERLAAARRRARFLPPARRDWTLDPPPWWSPPSWLSGR